MHKTCWSTGILTHHNNQKNVKFTSQHKCQLLCTSVLTYLHTIFHFSHELPLESQTCIGWHNARMNHISQCSRISWTSRFLHLLIYIILTVMWNGWVTISSRLDANTLKDKRTISYYVNNVCPSNMRVYLRDGSAQTILCAATLR